MLTSKKSVLGTGTPRATVELVGIVGIVGIVGLVELVELVEALLPRLSPVLTVGGLAFARGYSSSSDEELELLEPRHLIIAVLSAILDSPFISTRGAPMPWRGSKRPAASWRASNERFQAERKQLQRVRMPDKCIKKAPQVG